MSSTGEGDRPVAVDSPALDRWPTFALDHAIEAVGCDGSQCTIYPSDVPEDRRLTAWITATDDSFIAVDEIR
ncbi:DUF7511 domain-containing protein [Haloplanus halophilus]|uniref:DUF7511 domain-containing protein n=1 Tax=Haloplanus halophilus TaxID=2949993 RepID=UPI00203C8029|nr:hypothetical protein [Haloplanus sp. GDY1]